MQQIFGIHAVERLIKQAPQNLVRLVLIEGRLNQRQAALEQQASRLGIRLERQNKKFFDKLEGVHQGVYAEVKAQRKSFTEADLFDLVQQKEKVLLLFLDEVQDPHNLGAILRTADAVGVDAVIIPKNNSVGINATVSKVASGAAESVNLLVVTNLVRTLKELQDLGVWVLGLAGEAQNSIYQTSFSAKTALVMGAEGKGMRQLTRETCDELLSIPMLGVVESLNVSVATGVVLYEILRSRN